VIGSINIDAKVFKMVAQRDKKMFLVKHIPVTRGITLMLF